MNHSFLFIVSVITMSGTLTVKSSVFKYNDFIPVKYTCSGENINPPLSVGNIPADAKSLVLIIDDPDAPKGTFVHWVMWNIPVSGIIKENDAPGIQGQNGKMENKYTGPCPPSGTHHYHFKFYALNTKLELPSNTEKKALEDAMKGHIISSGELIGLFKK